MSEPERVILAACLRFPENISLVTDGLNKDHFSSAKHKALFSSIKSLHEKKIPIDPLSLSSELKGYGSEILPSELIELEDFYLDGMDIDYYKDQIKICFTKNKLQNFLSQCIEQVQDSSIEYSELQENITQGITEILTKDKPLRSKFIKRPEAFFSDIENLFKGGSINQGIPTGWEKFDDLLGDLRPNELTILTGETASGKTTWASNLAYLLSKKKHPVLITSFEMKPVNIVKKMLQMESNQPISSHTLESISPFFSKISYLPLYFVDIYGQIGLQQLKDAIFYAKRKHDIQFVILDHLHFFLRYSGDQERQAIDQALRDIKSWAMDLDIHIILIVHPTKLTYDNKVVHLNDLKGSSGLKQIPDNVLSIWRNRNGEDFKKPQNEVLLYILKVRDDGGDEGKVILTFDKRSQSYSDSRPGEISPVEGKRSPELPSPSPRYSLSGKDRASGYDQ